MRNEKRVDDAIMYFFLIKINTEKKEEKNWKSFFFSSLSHFCSLCAIVMLRDALKST